ncbi:MAG: 6-bladed beta-propeller [Longimicrobiales bacterium]
MIGVAEGPDEHEFGHVVDADLAGGRIIVVDAAHARVSVFDTAGKFIRHMGRVGSGPGEFMRPMSAAVLDSLIAIYDESLARIIVFDTSGTFRQSAQISTYLAEDLVAGPSGTILVSSKADSSARIFHYDLQGRLLRKLVQPPRAAFRAGVPELPSGQICSRSQEVVYANPWIYELVLFSTADGERRWSKTWPGALKDLDERAAEAAVLPPRGFTLGLHCTGRRAVLATLGLTSGKLFYDFFDSDFNMTGRMSFSRTSGEFPGFIGGLVGERMVTFRTKPFSQVFLYRLVE